MSSFTKRPNSDRYEVVDHVEIDGPADLETWQSMSDECRVWVLAIRKLDTDPQETRVAFEGLVEHTAIHDSMAARLIRGSK